MARFRYTYSNISPSGLANSEVEYENAEYEDPKVYTFTSRYKDTYRIIDSNNGCDYHSNQFNFYIPTTSTDVFVEYKGDGRDELDVLAEKYYGSSLWWWVIASASSIIDPLNIQKGTTLRIPSLDSLYSSESIFG